MSYHHYRGSPPDAWSHPRPYSDPSLRALAYGKVRPMQEPSWWERVLGLD